MLLFRVNRRPVPQNIFRQPDDVLQHLGEVLKFGEPVVTGRKTQRTWLLGNRAVDETARQLTGQIGWERIDSEAVDTYDSSGQKWTDRVGARGHAARSVFVFDAATRHLAVVRHPSFSDVVVPHVFRELLKRGEESRVERTTNWDVEPVLDEEEFRGWLKATSVVDRVHFVAKLPNPDGLDAFAGVWSRLEQLKASKIEETIKARDPEEGLGDIMSDAESREMIAMASNAFGYVTASGTTDGHPRQFDQRKKVKRIPIAFPATWEELVEAVRRIAGARGGGQD